MNKEFLWIKAREWFGTIENESLMEKVIEITLEALGTYYLYNYEIKDFMDELYTKRLQKGTWKR